MRAHGLYRRVRGGRNRRRGPARRKRRRARPRTRQQLSWTALKEANRPLRVAETAGEVKARGYGSTTANFEMVVASALTLMQMQLRRVGPGLYTLA